MKNHYRRFRGFGNEGTYIGHWKKSPSEVAHGFLKNFRGKKVDIEFYHAALQADSPEEIFTLYDQEITVPDDGSLHPILRGINTDNIKMIIFKQEGVKERLYYEVQRICIGNEEFTELSGGP